MRDVAAPQAGHLPGGATARRRAAGALRRTAMISGITSPARRSSTVSPSASPFSLMKPRLCRVARRTVTPPSATGSSSATGVSAPVRLTWNSTPRNWVRAVGAGNLCAAMPCGARASRPSARSRSRSLTLYTTPSIS